MIRQNSKVEHKTSKRTGVVISGIPFTVANRKYVEVRWNDDGKTSNVKVGLLTRIG